MMLPYNGVAFALIFDAEDLIRCLQLYYTLTIKMDATKLLFALTIAVDHVAREVRLSALGVIPKHRSRSITCGPVSPTPLPCRCPNS